MRGFYNDNNNRDFQLPFINIRAGKLKMRKNNTIIDRAEEREFIRRDILDSFKIYMMMPYLGSQRISIFNVSMKGLSFMAEPGMSINEGMVLDCYFYLNINIRIPLQVKVVHIADDCGITKAGCEIISVDSVSYKAYSKFIELLLALARVGED